MSINVGDLTAVAMRYYASKLHDNISNHNAFALHIKQDGAVKKYIRGGRVYSESVLYGDNNSIKFFDGYETFVPPTTDQNVIDFADYDPKQLGGFVSISSREEMQVSGPEQIRDFAETRVKQLMANLANTYGASLFSDGTGTGGKEIGGLQLLVADNPAAAGTVGGIDQNANSFWRNRTRTSAAAWTTSNIENELMRLWLDTIRGGDKPNRIYTDRNGYSTYWGSLVDKRRYTSSAEAEGSFTGLAFEKAKIYFDDNCPADRMYFVNTNDLCLYYTTRGEDAIFNVHGARDITKALYKVIPVEMMANLATGRRASHAVLINA